MIASVLSLNAVNAVKVAGLGSGSGVAAFFVASGVTSNPWVTIPVAVVASSLASVLVAWITNRPKMIAASGEAQVSERNQTMTSWANLLKQTNELHIERDQKLSGKIEEQAKIMALMRISKHNAMDAYGAACLHIRNLEEILKENKCQAPQFQQRSVKDIVGFEDQEMVNLVVHK